MTKVITDEMLDSLREKIKPYLKPNRYIHTLGVENEAMVLGNIYIPEKVNKLRVASLLHDITKKLSTEEQISLCEKYNIEVSDRLTNSPKLFHSQTAAELIQEEFSDYIDDEIVAGVRWHTTGRKNMTIFEAIVYLADYIEINRVIKGYDDCINLRNYFYNNYNPDFSYDDKMKLFNNTMIKSFNYTISDLVSDSKPLDIDTIEARNYFLLLD